MTELNNLKKHWRNFKFHKIPFIHEDDQIDKGLTIHRFEEYVLKAENLYEDEYIIHTGLLPVPFAGDLEKASIYILLTNPGFNHNDYYSEHKNEDYRNATINNIKQEKQDYPFIYLNPLFCHTSGGQYWLKKFDSIIRKLKSETNLSFNEILKLLSQNICTLELFPYHSKSFQMTDSKLNNLASVKQIKGFVQELSNDTSKTILCMRQEKNWGLEKLKVTNNNVKILPSNLSRSFSLKVLLEENKDEKESEFGKLIYDKLLKIINNGNK